MMLIIYSMHQPVDLTIFTMIDQLKISDYKYFFKLCSFIFFIYKVIMVIHTMFFNMNFSLYFERMNKKSQNNLSTSRILKSKYNQKEKQKTIPLVNKGNQKIKLLDLCPEEKLKIGELIKTLQMRKEQNEYLTEQFHQLTQKFKGTEDLLEKNIVLLHQRQKREVELLEKIQKYKEKLRIKQQLIMSLEKQNRKNRSNLQNTSKVQQSAQTEHKKQMCQVSLQTKNKKTKKKNQSIQVNTHETAQSVFFRAHSKSFQKIMKSSLPFENAASKELNKYLTTQRFTKKKCSSSGFERQSSPNIHDFQSSSDSAQLLAEKWRLLKQKHQNINPMCSSFGIKQLPRQYDSGCDEQIKVRIIPKIMKKIEEYDELELNKMLKSKKFSAKKLIQQRDQSNNKDTKDRMSPQVNYLKSPCFNNQNESENKSNKLSPSDPDINFFESDMLEIPDSIKV